MVVVGGVSRGVTGYTKSVEVYDVDSGTWSAGNHRKSNFYYDHYSN